MPSEQNIFSKDAQKIQVSNRPVPVTAGIFGIRAAAAAGISLIIASTRHMHCHLKKRKS
jgi:hypothetical protein